jgi:signal transduction histidine kinase
MKAAILTTEIQIESDVVFVRQRARHLARLLGFDPQDQTRISTAVSEIARNAFQYAGGGRVEFLLQENDKRLFEIRISDQGPGIARIQEIYDGQYRSETGMGLGLLGAKRLMDEFNIQTGPERGTTVTLGKRLASSAPRLGLRGVREISVKLVEQGMSVTQAPMAELREQNQELIRALDALQANQQELASLNHELEDTNRGVVALYAELDEKAEALRRANSTKTRFLSNMTHEFRTPLNSILQLTKLLLDRVDGELTPEQEKQTQLIRTSAQNLWEMVNDLLDLAKVEAGKIVVRPSEFTIHELFAGLRGLMRPLEASNPAVALVFEEAAGIPALFTDEAKLSQILRNFISNALKFTERGQVIVSAKAEDEGRVRISVADTGIGIAAADQERIFEDFYQVDSPIQRRFQGTGLGLPLTRKLAGLLGGKVELRSEPGKGSVFSAIVPARYTGSSEASYVGEEPVRPGLARGEASLPAAGSTAESSSLRVLIIDDREEDRYLLRSLLISHFDCTVLEAMSGSEGLELAEQIDPSVVFVDLAMPGLTGFEVLDRLRASPRFKDRPVIVHSGMELSEQDRQRLHGATRIFSKTRLSEEQLISAVIETFGQLGIKPKARAS